MSLKLTVLDSATLGGDIDLSMLEKFGELKIYSNTSPENFTEHVADSDVIILNKVRVGRQNLPECNILGRRGQYRPLARLCVTRADRYKYDP